MSSDARAKSLIVLVAGAAAASAYVTSPWVPALPNGFERTVAPAAEPSTIPLLVQRSALNPPWVRSPPCNAARTQPGALRMVSQPSDPSKPELSHGLVPRVRRLLAIATRTVLVSAVMLLPLRTTHSSRSVSLQQDAIAAPSRLDEPLLEEEYIDIRTLNVQELREELVQRGFSTSGSRKVFANVPQLRLQPHAHRMIETKRIVLYQRRKAELLARLEVALDLEQEADAKMASKSKKGGSIMAFVGKGAAGILGVSVVGGAALNVWNQQQEAERRRTQKLMGSFKPKLSLEDTRAEDNVPIEFVASKPPRKPSPIPAASIDSGAKSASAPSPVVSASPPPKPKGVMGNLFQKKSASQGPTVEELCMGDDDRAELCKTIAWALRAPVDVGADASRATSPDTKANEIDGASALALEILETLTEARNATERSLGTAAIAKCAEDVGRAMLLERVDAAADAIDNEAQFAEAALSLCRFVNNAAVVAGELGVTEHIGEVLYEGSQSRRKLERVFTSALTLATPELLAAMGMGDEDDAGKPAPGGKVDLDTVSLLAPLLKIREQKAERLMQDTMQRVMKSMMGGANGDGLDLSRSGGLGGPSMEKAVDMLEQMVDSGAVGPEDLESLRGLLSKQMGMPVEEMLKRKDELMAELPDEGKRLFKVIDKLFGDGAKEIAEKAKKASTAMPTIEDIPDDPNAAVSIKPGAISAAFADGGSSNANIKVNIRTVSSTPPSSSKSTGAAKPPSSADIMGIAKPMTPEEFISSVEAGANAGIPSKPASDGKSEPRSDAM